MDWTLRAEPLLFHVGQPIMGFSRFFDDFNPLGDSQSDVFVL
jgi:hypothetical protein